MYTDNDYRYYELCHHGILGQKWGIRRFQNKDGSLTSSGKIRYSNRTNHTSDKNRKGLSDKQKKALKIGLAAFGTAVAAYGAYKLNKKIGDWTNQQNVNLAALAGTDFANRLVEDIKPTNSGNFHRYSNGVRIAENTRAPFTSAISEHVYNTRGNRTAQLKRAISASQISKGKKSLDDILNYEDIAKKVINDTAWNRGGDEWLARALRDINRSGGKVGRFS